MRAGPLRRAVMVRPAILLSALVTAGLAADCPPTTANREDAAAKLQAFGQSAGEAFQRGDYARAAENFRHALCLAPDNAEIYHGLGLAEAAAGHFDQAAKALDQADRLAPHDFSTLLARAQVAASAGDFELAIRKLGEAEQQGGAGDSPAASGQANRLPHLGERTAARLHAQLGGELLERRKLDLALAQLLRATQAGLEDPAILLMLSTLENNLGAYTDAVRDSLRVDSSSAATVSQRATAAAVAGLAYKNQKKNEEAIRLLKQAIQLAPSETAYLALADIYETGKQTAEAVKLLEQGVAALPASQKIALAFGKILVNTGNNQRAAAFLAGLTQQDAADVEAWHWLAQAESSLGEFRKAAEALQQLARRQPDYPMIDVMIAQALLQQETPDYEQALRRLDRAEQAAPDDPDVHYLRGKAYSSMGRYAEAVKPLERAIELGPMVSQSYYQLGRVLQKLGRASEAQEQYDKVKYLKSAAQ